MTDRWECYKCWISFEVRSPRRAEFTAEHTICTVPGCDVRFWHAGGTHRGPVTTGINREDVPVFEPIPA